MGTVCSYQYLTIGWLQVSRKAFTLDCEKYLLACRHIDDDSCILCAQGQLTQNVGTCWYKSPEMLLGSANYGSAADIWSAGCIFAEMLNSGQPLFAGMRDLDQLRLVVDSIPLSDADWSHVLRVMPNKMLRNHPLKVQTPLVEKLDSVCPAGNIAPLDSRNEDVGAA